jgi:hypothetical protein
VFFRLANASRGLIAAGAAAGAALFGALSALARPLFSVPAGGVGFVTVNHYPKGFDYFVVAMIAAGAIAGGIAVAFLAKKLSNPATQQLSNPSTQQPSNPRTQLRNPATLQPTKATWLFAFIVFATMFFLHDHPYVLMEPFHEGEHLTPGFLFRSGERPFGDVFVLHGLAVDGGLDALVLGNAPSPRRERRLETVLDAATLALLVPIAAEVCTTPVGALLAAIAALCAIGAGQIPVFPYFRFAPLLVAVLALLRYVRGRGTAALFTAMAASTIGLLWSLDIGLYAVMTTAVMLVVLRVWRPWLTLLAAALPFVILLALRADIAHFVRDSFVIIPGSIDAIWSLPMRADWSASWSGESVRYFVPPAFYGLLLVLALRAYARGERDVAARLTIVAVASLLAFRSAAGRCGWSHTRYGVPLLGVALVAFLAEPLILARRWITAGVLTVALLLYVDVWDNAKRGGALLAGWHARQSHAGLVAYPMRSGKGIYTTPDNAADLGALYEFVNAHATPGAPILDVSNERALAYLLERKPATRCNDIAMLSAPPLLAEAMRELAAHPPPLVILSGSPFVDQFDNLPNRQRVPQLFAWIDAKYPKREKVGRFVVATR